MPENEPKDVVDKALAALDAAGVDVESLRFRLQDQSIRSVVVGPWPPETASRDDVNALVKTRSLLLESLDLLEANAADPQLLTPLADYVTQASELLNEKEAGIGKGNLPGALYRSIVGRWPPD
ncbi:hypothetical protein [Qipengyuania sp.]|uniref:hypothetical protein n=1 Tax=Qipengyuania sp. TaxID=2004515 RepID=UPI003518DD09